jgi:hypothetical protein
MMRHRRSVLKAGIIKYDNARWHSAELGALAGDGQRFVFVVEPATADATALRVEDRDGTFLATASRVVDTPAPAPAPPSSTPLSHRQLRFGFEERFSFERD